MQALPPGPRVPHVRSPCCGEVDLGMRVSQGLVVWVLGARVTGSKRRQVPTVRWGGGAWDPGVFGRNGTLGEACFISCTSCFYLFLPDLQWQKNVGGDKAALYISPISSRHLEREPKLVLIRIYLDSCFESYPNS